MCRRYSRYISCVDRWSSVGLVIHVVSFTRAYTIIHYTSTNYNIITQCYMLHVTFTLHIIYIYIYHLCIYPVYFISLYLSSTVFYSLSFFFFFFFLVFFTPPLPLPPPPSPLPILPFTFACLFLVLAVVLVMLMPDSASTFIALRMND